jgi:catechol 2,3-dioxygenase-like lactoylglutathione lyase family enzyme
MRGFAREERGPNPADAATLRRAHVSDSSKTSPPVGRSVRGMAPRFDLIGLVVADMATSLAFYRRLGLDIPAGCVGEPHVECTLPTGTRVAFDTIATIQSFDPSFDPAAHGHGVSLAFACDDPTNVDATFAMLVAAGAEAHLEPWDAFWGQRYATLRDPDGNGIDLFAPLV